jgi:NADH-quinone oxidoreductase subunit L
MNPNNAAALVLLLPLLSAFTILVLNRTVGTTVCKMISVGSAALCFLVSLATLGIVNTSGTLLSFLNVGKLHANIGYIIDQQSRGMLFIVTFIGLLVHVYSLGYMKEDKAQSRYFGSLSMFMFSMTGIVLADNFAMIFIFWELVGLSSYLLIGHWFEKPEACEASKKAFLTNRIGDFGFMIGILTLWTASNGEIGFAELKESLSGASTSGPLHSAPAWVMTLAALGIFMGAVGKSAQVPLHVWLPDAMEGPTPVSALIHAATMVAAGVFMLVRVSFILVASPFAMQVISVVGCVTAVLAALMAVQQNDIKRILAYSTLSQLGYMVMAVGLGAGEAGMFHLYTHAFFKALLFLGAGAVIYACHHEQDIWKMGGLSKKTPATFITFAIGTLALMGLPGMSGFFSKEEILGAAYHECGYLFAAAAFTALLTSFYMSRCVIVAFFGKARSENADHAHEAPMIMIAPLMLLAIFAVFSGYGFFSDKLQAMVPLAEHSEGHGFVMAVSIAAVVIGAGLAFFLYWGKDKDPLNIKLFANRFYVDEIYAVIVKVFQDRLAWLVTGLDSIFADGLVARLPAAIACRVGKTARAIQSGHLQGYTFVLGAGLLLAIYLVVQVLPKH